MVWDMELFDCLVVGFHPLFQKYAQVKLDHFPKKMGVKITNLSNHHLVMLENDPFLLNMISFSSVVIR